MFPSDETSFLVYDAERTCTQCSIETLSVRSSDSESAVVGTTRRVVFLSRDSR